MNKTLISFSIILSLAAGQRTFADSAYEEQLKHAKELGQSGQTGEAMQALSDLIAAHPDRPEAYVTRAYGYYEAGNYDQALADYTRAIELKPDAATYHERGIIYLTQQKIPEVMADFDKAIELDPTYIRAWFDRGTGHFMTGAPEKALIDFNKVIELDPQDHQAYHMRAQALEQLGKGEEALADFDKEIELAPNDYQAHIRRGMLLTDLYREKESIEAFSRAIAIEPQNTDAYSYRAITYFLVKDYENSWNDVHVLEKLDSSILDVSFLEELKKNSGRSE